MQHLSVLLSKATSDFRHPLWVSKQENKHHHHTRHSTPWLSGGAQNNVQAKKTTSKTVSNQIFKHNGYGARGHFTALLIIWYLNKNFTAERETSVFPILNHNLRKPLNLAFWPLQLTFCSTLHVSILILTHC